MTARHRCFYQLFASKSCVVRHVQQVDENEDPVFDTVPDDAFTILAPDSRFGVGDPGEQIYFNTTPGLTLPLHSGERSFDLDGSVAEPGRGHRNGHHDHLPAHGS